MTTSEILVAAWKSLKQENFIQPGYYERRIFSDSDHSLFAGISRPSNLFQLDLAVSMKNAARIADEETKGFRLSRAQSPSENKIRLRLELTDISYGDLFLVVSSDILMQILKLKGEQKAVEAFRHRLDHWIRFMKVSGPDGLSRMQQIGLFGELLVLKTLFKISDQPESILISWQGPKGGNQDFVHKDCAIEVKTTEVNEPTRVNISNELQLDNYGFTHLILCHISVDERIGSGTSLPNLVDEISGMLDSHLIALFMDYLMEAGYHDIQRHLYADSGFIERSRNYYEITDNFPRVTPKDLRVGVSKVRYQIDLSGVYPIKDSESQLIKIFLDVIHE